MNTVPLRTLVTLVFFVAPLSGCKSSRESFDKGFKSSFEKEFNASCVRSAASAGNEADVKRLCACVGQQLLAHHTTTELTKISVDPDAAESKTAFAQAMHACGVSKR